MTLVPQHIVLQSPASNDPLLDLNTQPSLDLQFATGKTLDDRVSGFPLVNHQRDASSGKSAGTYVGSDGLIKTSLVNYAINSEQVDLWDLSRGSISANFAESPIGDLTADKWIPDAFSDYHYPKLTTTLSSASSVTYSIYAKQAGYRYLLINTPRGSTSGNAGPIVDLQDGVVVGNFTATNPTTVADAGNGWWRVAMTFTGTGTAINVDHNPLPTSTIAAYAGDGTSGVLLWGAQLEEGTTATDYIPTTTTISGAPRFDHDPVTSESLGLLIEEERTNSLEYSEQFDQWTAGSNSVITPNATTAPDGTLTADTVFLAELGGTFISQSVTLTQGKVYTFSVYAKAVTPGSDNEFIPYISSPTPRFPVNSLEATSEWVRFSFTFTHTDNTASTGVFLSNRADAYTTNVHFWGAQLEAGSFATSYIPTSGTTVTRAADIASITGTNFSSWYNQSEGTAFAEYDGLKDYARVLELRYGKPLITSRPTINSAYDGATETASIADVGLTLGDTRKSVTAYSGTTTTVTINGLVPVTGNSDFTSTTSDGIYLGGQGNDVNVLNGHISRLAYYPYRLPDATLQEITS